MANKITNIVTAGESIHAETNDTRNSPAIYARNNNGAGAAISALAKGTGAGLWAVSENGEGVHAETNNGSKLPALSALTTKGDGAAVYAVAKNNGIGVHSISKKREAIVAETSSKEGHAAIAAYNNTSEIGGAAIYASCDGSGTGVNVSTKFGPGVNIVSKFGFGLVVENNTYKSAAIFALNTNTVPSRRSTPDNGSAIYAENLGTAPTIYAKSAQGKTAGYFEGDVEITGKLKINGADLMDVIARYELRIAKLEKMYVDHKSGIDALPR